VTDKLTSRLRQALVRAGYTDSRNGNPSIRALSIDLGLNNSRVSRYFFHGSKMQLDARKQIAESLGMELSELDSEVSETRVDSYSPPKEANLLTPRERRLVNDLIHVLATRRTEDEEVTGNDNPAPIAKPDDKVAQLRPERPVTRKFTPRWERDEDAASEGEKGIGVGEIPDEST